MFTYLTAVPRTGTQCAQCWNIIKANKPNVSQVFLRSDSAGCYHNNNLIAAAFDIGVQVGIKVMR